MPDEKMAPKGATLTLLAPISGLVTPLDAVADPLIRHRIVGDGVAIEPLGHRLLAPVDSVITTLAATGHQLTLTTPTGVEIMMIIGSDALSAHGVGYTIKARQGDRVLAGDCLLELDLLQLRRLLPSTLISILLCNIPGPYEIAKGQVRSGETLLRCNRC